MKCCETSSRFGHSVIPQLPSWVLIVPYLCHYIQVHHFLFLNSNILLKTEWVKNLPKGHPQERRHQIELLQARLSQTPPLGTWWTCPPTTRRGPHLWTLTGMMIRRTLCSWNQRFSRNFVFFFVTFSSIFIGSIKFYAENSIHDPLFGSAISVCVALIIEFCHCVIKGVCGCINKNRIIITN